MSPTPSIYIACLASYNAGILHGEWIDLDGTEDIRERIQDILNESPIDEAEEYAVHDHEYCGNLSEYPGLDSLKAITDAYIAAEYQGIDWEAYIEFCEHTGADIDEKHINHFQDSFAGAAVSLEDWCYEHLEESGQLSSIPENLRNYFNHEAFARDMEINDVFTIHHNQQVLVFWNS